MKKIVVNDTNVFIDLLDVGLLDEFFCLPWEIHTTDFVMLELLREGQKETVEVYETKGDLHVAKFEYDEFLKINNLFKKFKSRTNISRAFSFRLRFFGLLNVNPHFLIGIYIKRNGIA